MKLYPCGGCFRVSTYETFSCAMVPSKSKDLTQTLFWNQTDTLSFGKGSKEGRKMGSQE